MLSKQFIGGLVAILALAAIFYFGRPQEPITASPTGSTPTFHQVNADGSRGPAVPCTSTRPFAEGKSEAELQATARQYGVTVDVVRTWYVCIQN